MTDTVASRKQAFRDARKRVRKTGRMCFIVYDRVSQEYKAVDHDNQGRYKCEGVIVPEAIYVDVVIPREKKKGGGS